MNLNDEDLDGMFICSNDLSPDLDGEIDLRFSAEKRGERNAPCEDDPEVTAPYIGAILFESKIGRKSKGREKRCQSNYNAFRDDYFLVEYLGAHCYSDKYEKSGDCIFRKLP